MPAPRDERPPQTLAERYGQTSRVRRRAGLAAVAVGAAALLGWAVWATVGQAGGGLDAAVQSYRVTSPHSVAVTVQVSRPDGDAVRCVVLALASDHSTVGESEVTVPAGSSGTLTVRTVVKTERQATTADIGRCR